MEVNIDEKEVIGDPKTPNKDTNTQGKVEARSRQRQGKVKAR